MYRKCHTNIKTFDIYVVISDYLQANRIFVIGLDVTTHAADVFIYFILDRLSVMHYNALLCVVMCYNVCIIAAFHKIKVFV